MHIMKKNVVLAATVFIGCLQVAALDAAAPAAAGTVIDVGPVTFPVPFSGRALLENNRFSGKGSGNPYGFGPGVKETVEIR